MSIAHILNDKGREVITTKPDATVSEVALLLTKHDIGAVVISNDTATVLGIVSERDIVRVISKNGSHALQLHAADIMTTNVYTAHPDDRETELMALMTERHIRHVPVMQDGRLAGMISIGDVVKQRIEEIEREAAEMKAYISTSY